MNQIKTSLHEEIPPKGLAEYLDYCRDRYCSAFLQKFELRAYESHSSVLGGFYKYTNGHFRLQLLNDRGVFQIAISSNYGAENFRDIEVLHSLMRKDEMLSLETSQSGFPNPVLIHDQYIAWMETNYPLVINLFSLENYQQTEQMFAQLGPKKDVF